MLYYKCAFLNCNYICISLIDKFIHISLYAFLSCWPLLTTFISLLIKSSSSLSMYFSFSIFLTSVRNYFLEITNILFLPNCRLVTTRKITLAISLIIFSKNLGLTNLPICFIGIECSSKFRLGKEFSKYL